MSDHIDMHSMDAAPPEAFVAGYPEPMQVIAHRLRAIVRRAMPDSIERVRPGWKLIGYDLPAGRRTIYFAYVALEREHVHLGFEHGWAMRDPHGRLQGLGITRQVRWLTFRPGDVIDARVCEDLVREAAAVASMSRGERTVRAMDGRPDDPDPGQS